MAGEGVEATAGSPLEVPDLLARDHRRLDELLAGALRRLDAGDLLGAHPLIAACVRGIRHHVRAENDLLAPRLPLPADADGVDPLALMRQEHDDLLRQVREIEAALDFAELTEAGEIEPLVVALTVALERHEHREQASVLPRWQAALAAWPGEQRGELEDSVRAALEG